MITMSMIQELQKRLNVIRGRVDALKKNCEDYKLGMDNCDRLVVEMENATNVLFNFNIWLNERTKTRLEGITNEALSLIFPDKTMKFHVTPNQTKKGVSYELSIETDGVMTDLLDAKGGGVLDVIQICLRLTYILRLKNVTRQLVLFDEPFKNLDSERVGSAVEWLVTPNVVEGWIDPPKVQISQAGYLPGQPKTAVAELDRNDTEEKTFTLWKISPAGTSPVCSGSGTGRGRFLRYRYLSYDFTGITQPGLYQISYGETRSSVFRIAPDVFERGVWQPVLEYFLPVQMCHMRVNEKYRVWHGRCHLDDARMAPVNWNHFDGYHQGSATLTRFAPGDCVPGLNCGGWHDAGDFDLRVESQSGEAYLLALTYETFHVEWDSTTIDQQTKTVEIHQPVMRPI